MKTNHWEHIPKEGLPKLSTIGRNYIINTINKYHNLNSGEKNKLYKLLKSIVQKNKWLKQRDIIAKG